MNLGRSASSSVVSVSLALLGSFLAVSARAQDLKANERAVELFAKQCALCHDADGRARGAIARLLVPPPRDFGEGLFQLSSGDNGVPLPSDIERVIEHGLPGSGMPAFPNLAPADRTLLASHVALLSIEAIATRIQGGIEARGDQLDRQEALKLAEWEMTPEIPAPFAAFPTANESTLATGRRIYLERCAACHGVLGEGRAVVPGWRDGDLFAARDLRKGILKGGSSVEDLARRIRAGMPGRGMPPTQLAAGETEALAVFVHTLLPEGAEQRYTQTHLTLDAKRVKELPANDDAAWKSAREVRLVLSPLASRADAVMELKVAALHDGKSIAFRLRWHDETRDDRALGKSKLPDGVALQFSSESNPPLFGMGSLHQPLNQWHWKAFHPDRIATFFDLLHDEGYPRDFAGSVSGAPNTKPPAGLLQPETKATSSSVVGPGTASANRGDSGIEVLPTHVEGEWQVIVRRSLKGKAKEDITFTPGGTSEFCCAVWNGSAGDYGPRKSVSIWNTLTLEP